jgi:hypothetical protein
MDGENCPPLLPLGPFKVHDCFVKLLRGFGPAVPLLAEATRKYILPIPA